MLTFRAPEQWLDAVEIITTEMADDSWPKGWNPTKDDGEDPYNDAGLRNGDAPPNSEHQLHFDEFRAYDYSHDGTLNVQFADSAYGQQPAYSGDDHSWQYRGGAHSMNAYSDQGQGRGDTYGDGLAALQMPGRVGSSEPWLHDGTESALAHQDQDNTFDELGGVYYGPQTPDEQGSPIEQPKLFNPYDDGAEPAYIRIETADEVIFKYATAGDVVSTAGLEKPQWERQREVNDRIYDGNQWGRWETEEEWDDAYWMSTSKTSQSSLQDLLKTSRVS